MHQPADRHGGAGVKEIPEDLIVRFLNDDCTSEEARTLASWLKAAPENADTFASYAALHSNLRSQLVRERISEGEGVFVFDDPIEAIRPRQSMRVFATVGGACLLVLGFLLFHGNQDVGEPFPKADQRRNSAQGEASKSQSATAPPEAKTDTSVATIVEMDDVVWSRTESSDASRLKPGTIGIDRGVALIRTDQGVDLTVQGPAEIELVSPTTARLRSGIVSANVPATVTGFTILTPRFDIVDLGTFFAVNAAANDTIDVTVFEGAVSLRSADRTLEQVLRAGAAVRSDRGVDLVPMAIPARSFEAMWPMASGILRYSEVFALPAPGSRIEAKHSDTNIFVYAEGGWAPLPEDLRVNISRPAEYRKVGDLTEDILSRETLVRSYLVQFRPEYKRRQRGEPIEFHRRIGELTFTDPILGVIILEDELSASERILSSRVDAELLGRNRSIELSDREYGDFLSLSADRRKLRVELRASSGYSDHLRVIVGLGDRNRGSTQ